MTWQGSRWMRIIREYYPYGDLASRVLGFTGGDNQGIIGLEVKYEDYLKGNQRDHSDGDRRARD